MTAATEKNKNHHHHHHHHHNISSNNNNNEKNRTKEAWDLSKANGKSNNKINKQNNKRCNRHTINERSESVLSSDSDIRFTRKKLGENQKCGCALIAGFLLTLLFAGGAVYIGYTYLRPDPLPDRVFRAKFKVIQGETWTPELADQNSLRFQHKARDYRERINLVVRRSDLRTSYEGSEILALDGNEDKNDLKVHFILYFDPYRGLVSTADLHAIFAEEISTESRRYFANITVDPDSLDIKEVRGQEDLPDTSSAPLGGQDDVSDLPTTTQLPPRRCERLALSYCKNVGYNMTTYPNLLGHISIEEVEADVITFRELVDAECFRQAFDFVCRLLQPPCEVREPHDPIPSVVCREYCQSFWNGCGDRLTERFKRYFDCERFPESVGIQSCHTRPGCAAELQTNALSSRLCDGIADCPDLSDEMTCSFCPPNSMYCGRGRACIPRTSRCDGKIDCPDGNDEKDCLSVSPLVSLLTDPKPLTPQRPRFYSQGFATFSERGTTGKLCTEGINTDKEAQIRSTVAESLCKALGYEKAIFSQIRNDTESNTNYVRVLLNPQSEEISFIRTQCASKQVLYVACDNLECGLQSILPHRSTGFSLSKMAAPGDWPWHVALFRSETHVCDGTLISADWVLTTESCFQGQPKATWLAIFGAVRLTSNAPWTQRRRIVGMVKSPVEGSTAALVRLETSIVFSDFIRPICLPDQQYAGLNLQQTASNYENINYNSYPDSPRAEGLDGGLIVETTTFRYPERRTKRLKEDRQFFETPIIEFVDDGFGGSKAKDAFSAEFLDEGEKVPRAEAQNLANQKYSEPDIPPNTQYDRRNVGAAPRQSSPPIAPVVSPNLTKTTEWGQCNTLGWSRQRDHLQRVQLKIGDMSTCENVSIATVNSMCAEAAYHKQDCSEEEYAGSPIVCLLPDGKRWSLIGITSWRIACAVNGIERPRMYDKITSNSAWIRETVNAT